MAVAKKKKNCESCKLGEVSMTLINGDETQDLCFTCLTDTVMDLIYSNDSITFETDLDKKEMEVV